MIQEIETLLVCHLKGMETRLANHERRMLEMNAEHRGRNEAILARLQLELDALPR